MKNFIIAAIIIGVSIIAGCKLIPTTVINYGGSGADHYTRERFLGGIMEGGATTRLSQTYTTSTTMTAKEFCDSSIIIWAASSTNASTTLPSANALGNDCLNVNGLMHTILFRNIAELATQSAGFIAGTDMDLIGPTPSSGTVDVLIEGGKDAFITCGRQSGTSTVWCSITEYLDAD